MQSSGGAGDKPTAFEQVTLQIPSIEQPLQLCIHGKSDQFVSRRLREKQIWEPFETALVIASLQPGNTFLDIGANIGYFSILAAHLVGPGGQVFAFEPDPDNCALMRRSIALNHQESVVQVHEAALSDHDGDGVLYLNPQNLGDHQVYSSGQPREQRAIRLVQGSDYLGPLLSQLHLVKIDTQGSEFQVIEGLMPLLANLEETPRMLVELTPFSLRAAGSSGSALIELLARLRQPFWIVDHLEHRLVPTTAQDLMLWCGNVDSIPADEGFMNIFLGAAPAGHGERA